MLCRKLDQSVNGIEFPLCFRPRSWGRCRGCGHFDSSALFSVGDFPSTAANGTGLTIDRLVYFSKLLVSSACLSNLSIWPGTIYPPLFAPVFTKPSSLSAAGGRGRSSRRCFRGKHHMRLYRFE